MKRSPAARARDRLHAHRADHLAHDPRDDHGRARRDLHHRPTTRTPTSPSASTSRTTPSSPPASGPPTRRRPAASNPATGATDTGLGVFQSGDDGGCDLGGGTLVIGFKWKEWASRNATTTADTYTTRVAALRLPAGDQRARAADVRRRHARRASSRSRRRVAVGADGHVRTAAPTCPCAARHRHDHGDRDRTTRPRGRRTPSRSPPPCARPRRPRPAPRNAAGSPLLALGSGTCSGGTATGMSVAGNTTVVVNGQAAINATDVGACTAMTANGSITVLGQRHLARRPAVPVPATSARRPRTTPLAIGDPFASLPVTRRAAAAAAATRRRGHARARTTTRRRSPARSRRRLHLLQHRVVLGHRHRHRRVPVLHRRRARVNLAGGVEHRPQGADDGRLRGPPHLERDDATR